MRKNAFGVAGLGYRGANSTPPNLLAGYEEPLGGREREGKKRKEMTEGMEENTTSPEIYFWSRPFELVSVADPERQIWHAEKCFF